MNGADDVRFSMLFDRAVVACAEAQLLATRCRDAQASARAAHASSLRLRKLAGETRTAWGESDRLFDVVRREVELVAHGLREDGVKRAHASALVRAHVRFVLYDGGLREQEAESVVTRASDWVNQVYQAA